MFGAGSMKILGKLAILAIVVTFGAGGASGAQQTPKSKSAPPAAQTPPAPAAPQGEAAPAGTPPPASWAVRCASAGRDAPLECAMEQTAVLSKTGQLVVVINIRVAGDTRAPIALVQLPLGLNLAAGTKLQVDDGKIADLPIQTCEARGCYATGPVAPELLAALRSGKQLKLSFQSLAKETLTIPVPLADFAAAYDKIK
jgi:invasion protein IalB